MYTLTWHMCFNTQQVHVNFFYFFEKMSCTAYSSVWVIQENNSLYSNKGPYQEASN